MSGQMANDVKRVVQTICEDGARTDEEKYKKEKDLISKQEHSIL